MFRRSNFPEHESAPLDDSEKASLQAIGGGLKDVASYEYPLTEAFWQEVRVHEAGLYATHLKSYQERNAWNRAYHTWDADYTAAGQSFDSTRYSALHDMQNVPLFRVQKFMLAMYMQNDTNTGKPAFAQIYQLDVRHGRESMICYPMFSYLGDQALVLSSNQSKKALSHAKKLHARLDPTEQDALTVIQQLRRGVSGEHSRQSV